MDGAEPARQRIAIDVFIGQPDRMVAPFVHVPDFSPAAHSVQRKRTRREEGSPEVTVGWASYKYVCMSA
ncbi:uncharacterized protein FOMMEDRAFT_21935 [Fomitiporia mediterranea MF3/22]|uniref:uncharacterized protein n=1 Tax=Fomitiporia mediterranea (strain MF3/22) TaxID=694068 RepID=UPI0004407894|nr:uncharacterized protein FOMMEDRAFT_21935 [Fomitiporia mediterranea MF3/22]EJD01570.1 hypothetical protein FOMMEDRAFT_21935 [Fomitiporia mediterranea MF3/22]